MLAMRSPIMFLFTFIIIFCLSDNTMADEDNGGPMYSNKANILGGANNYETHLNDMVIYKEIF